MTYGLVAIVKDEIDRIAAFLDSAMAVCGVATIVDTGSTDGTREWLDGAEFVERLKVYDSEWVDFGHNRSEAFAQARGSADWLLALDADMTVEVDPGFDPDPAVDAYTVEMGNGGSFRYRLPLVLRGDLPWRSVGAVHEYTCLPDRPYTSLPTDKVRVRYPERSSPAKSAWHARMLEAEVERDPGNARAVFYLAQTYRDLGRLDEARDLYRRRAAMGGYAEEAYYAAYRGALLDPWPERAASLLAAWEMRPTRLEALHALLTDLNSRGLHQAAYALSFTRVEEPTDALFVHREAWDWGIAFERSIAAWWVGQRGVAAALNQMLLESDIPAHIREAVVRNAAF